MPNFCLNIVKVSHADRRMMELFSKGISDGNLFENLVPMNADDDRQKKWGTRSDVGEGEFDLNEDQFSGTGLFYTAGSPPIEAYKSLGKLGFLINASYHEPESCIAGTWSNQDGDDFFEYDFENENWRDEIDNPEVVAMLEDEYCFWLEDREGNDGD